VPSGELVGEPGGASGNDLAREAIERLQAWDFRMDADKVEPLLFTAWLREFAHDLLFRRLGSAATDYWDLKPQLMENVLVRRPEWCADSNSPRPDPPSCNELLATSLGAALAGLRQAYGPEMAQWLWGRAHIARFVNPVFSRIALLRDWAQASVPTPGGFDTVNRGPTTIQDDAHPYEQRFGSGLRIVTDLASPADSRMIVAPGQSGNPLSPHFSDLVQRWRQFEWLVPGRASAVATLTLEPAR
jgi:penicillin G amidase